MNDWRTLMQVAPIHPQYPQKGLSGGLFEDIEHSLSLCPLGDAAPTPAVGPCWLPGDLVQVRHQDGLVEAGQVEGVTRIESPSPCKPGYWYWVAATSEAWFHESLLKPPGELE